MKTIHRYCKLKDAKSSDHIRVDSVTMFEGKRTYLTWIIHNKEYTRLHYPLDDTIGNKSQLAWISPLCNTHFSDLLKIRKCKGNQEVDGVTVTADVDIASKMKCVIIVCQFEPIVKVCVKNMNRV